MRWRKFALLIGILFVLLVPFEGVTWLRGPAGWRWPYVPPTLTEATVALGGMALFVVGWWWMDRWQGKRPFLALTLLFTLTLIAQFTLLGADPVATLFDDLASDQASGYWAVAQTIEDVPTFLRDYPQLMPTFRPDPHPRSKPPGIVLLYVELEQLLAPFPQLSTWLAHFARGVRCNNLWLVAQSDAGLAAGVLMGLLTPILSALIIFPAYGLIKQWRDPQNAWLVAGLMAIFPGRLIFTPHMDSLYPTLALFAFWFAVRGITSKQYRWTFISGLILSVLTFLSLVNGIVAVVVGLVIAGWLLWRQWREAWQPFLWHGTVLVLGTITIWLLYFAFYHVDPLAIYHAAEPARHDLARSYWVWLWGNVYDFALFVGLPLFLLALQPQQHNRFLATLWAVFWGVFLLLDVSGVIRGEVGRIWLMLAGFPILLIGLPSKANNKESYHAPAYLALLACTTLMMGLFWQVTETEWGNSTIWEHPNNITGVPMHPRDWVASYETTFSDANQQIMFLEAGWASPPNQDILVRTRWQSITRPDIAYKLFLHLTDPTTGQIVAQTDQAPDPVSTCWHEEMRFEDIMLVDVANVANGRYALTLGLYNPQTGDRLLLPDGSNTLSLGFVELNP